MELILLGTGTSQGVPLLGHPNDGLDLSEPKNWRNRSCAHLVCDGAHIQIDAGPEFRLACMKFGVPAVDYFFLTHGHSDHILGMDDLRRFCDLRDGKAIPVWTTPEGKARIEAIYPYGIRPQSSQGYIALLPELASAEMTLPCGTRVQTTILPHGPRFVSLGMVFTEKNPEPESHTTQIVATFPPKRLRLQKTRTCLSSTLCTARRIPRILILKKRSPWRKQLARKKRFSRT